MSYTKKFLVLKEISSGWAVNGKGVSGVCRVETEAHVTTLNISLINFAAVSDGFYVAYAAFDGGEGKYIELGANPFTFETQFDGELMREGFACLIAFVNDEQVSSVAYGCCSSLNFTAENMARFISEHVKKTKTDDEKNKSVEQTEICAEKNEYDDETVATENYFLIEDANNQNAKITEEENEQAVCETDVSAEPESAEKCGGEETPPPSPENESAAADAQKDERGKYYLRVKSELDEIFTANPEDTTLTRCIPESKWVRINYAEGKHYVVGIVYDKMDTKYICYGVPAKYSPTPPKELDGFCSFIPLSLFEMKGDGYWMMFQDAATGECVHIK